MNKLSDQWRKESDELTSLRKDKARLDYVLSCGFLLKQGDENWSYIPVRHDEDGRKIIDKAMEGK